MQGKSLMPMLVVLWGSAFLAGFNENVMNMALVSIMEEFGIGSVDAQWTVTGYVIVATIVVVCMAYLYRRFGLRKLFFAASAFSFVGAVLGLFSPNFAFLMAARLIQAVGTGMLIPLMMNTVLAVTPKNKLGAYMSIGSCMITFGPAFSPVVCGALVSAFGWRSVFLVPAAAMAAFAVAGAFTLRGAASDAASDEARRARLDVPSVVLAVLMLSFLSWGLSQLTSNPLIAAATLAAFALLAVAFVVRQLRCAHPLIDLTPVFSRAFWPSLILTGIAMLGSFSCSVLLPLYFESACGLTALMAGLLILVPVLGNAATALMAGRLFDKHGEWPLLPVGFAAIACGFALMAFVAPALSLPGMFVAAFVVYASTGFIFSPSQTAGLKSLPPEQNPFGVALSTAVVQLATCVAPALYTGIMSSGQSTAVAQGVASGLAAAQGFSMAMVVAAVIAALGAALAFFYARAALRRAAVRREERVQSAAPTFAALVERDAYTIASDAPVREAMRELVSRGVNGMPLVDGAGRAAGFVSDGDIMRYLAEHHPLVTNAYSLMRPQNDESFDVRLRELMDLPVSVIATERAVTIAEGATIDEACSLLATHKLKKVPVVDGEGRIVGTVNRTDILHYALKRALEEA